MQRDIDQTAAQSASSEWSGSRPCAHSVQANGDDATIELELNAQDLIDIVRLPSHQSDLHPLAPNASSRQAFAALPEPEKCRDCGPFGNGAARAPVIRAGAVLAVAFASILSGRMVYRAAWRSEPSPAEHALLQARLSEPEAPQQHSSPVRFKNPFDPSEVFDFPPGTSNAKAREAVANLLIERARDRQTQRSRTRNQVSRR